jgi:phosphohistidine phosphatase
MKRTLVLIRHAKSAMASGNQQDYDRPLNDRGERDAPEMGKRLAKQLPKPDLIIASTAKRTTQTATKIAVELNYSKSNIQWEEKLYHAMPETIEEVIYGISDEHTLVFLVAHNPGITMMANSLANTFSIDNMPTCGVVACTFDAAHWQDFSKAVKKIVFFDYPKN